MLDRLTRGDLVQVVDLSRACVDAGSLADLCAVLDRVASLTSFTRIAVGTVGPGPHGTVEHYVNHSFGAAWEELYVGRGFSRIDHVLEHARRARGPFHWSDATPSGSSLRFAEAARDHGLFDGVTDPFRRGPDEPWSMISAGTPRDRDPEQRLVLLGAVAPHVHEAYARLRRTDAGARAREAVVKLTAREREVLAWLQDGKTYWEIGHILGISERTVKFHFARLKAKLDAMNRSHAVAKALRLGLLDGGA